MGGGVMENLRHWTRFADIDPQFAKKITGKPYQGTSPSPQYVIKCLTEMFGPVGQGFGWEVIAEAFTPLGDEVLHWCRISFWHTSREHTYQAYGQTKALMKTKNGLTADEDAPKKSLTDAIVKAASQLGIASNIFLGRWDDQKYVAEVDAEYRQEEKASAKPRPPSKDLKILQRNLLSGVKEFGPSVGDDPRFKRDLAKLKQQAAELAAEVEFELSKQKQEQEAA